MGDGPIGLPSTDKIKGGIIMDFLGKLAIAAGTGLFVGGAIQKAIDNREREDENFREEHRKLNERVKNQEYKMDDMRKENERLRSRMEELKRSRPID